MRDPATLKNMLDATIGLVRLVARQEIMPRFLRVAQQQKADGSLFSEADLAAQHFLARELKKVADCPVVGEEMTEDEQALAWAAGRDGLWCIDPIDGTTNFINGIPLFAVSVAFFEQGRPRLAVTFAPVTDEMFYAREGNGAYLNGQRLPLRPVADTLERAVAGVDFKRIPKPLADRLACEPPFYSQRNFGCSTLEWCFVAAGRLDVYLHGGQMLWDYCAGSLILKEAGGAMATLEHTDFNEAPVWKRPVMAALNPKVFSAWQTWIRG
ncbi:myo-inositol-1(or 4)-monophosphatase [Oryzomicrobium terrae]|jgi:myo-inositol-1(or 4)-monophosphatase|uniref:Myo-inositol-1(Or 4)-monophosphatase n=1 Tax=Oryzomicrobium terrae TaxID=1735038 RepID=A0A5C1ECQ0_9RHOO|nr:inositol monophosphatase family protein [Oryzomicrobium terrae]QEL66058.1 myo-inositol-1(or 4)-monophosphatase [Oryzomicrobium terrae]